MSMSEPMSEPIDAPLTEREIDERVALAIISCGHNVMWPYPITYLDMMAETDLSFDEVEASLKRIRAKRAETVKRAP